MRAMWTVLLLATFCWGAFNVSAADDGTLFVRKLTVQPDGTRVANVISFDESGKIREFGIDDLQILEDGVKAEILDVTCPEPVPPVFVSSVLTIDVSGSMTRGRPSNLTLAIEAASAWIAALSDTSECAITTFDHTGQVLTDFTSDKNRLRERINSLTPNGGTNFEEGLLNASSGGLTVVREGINKRVVVFLTDGNGLVSSNKVIEEARKNNVTIYCVSLGLRMPNALRTIAEQTGGLWFESVTTVEEAVMAYRRIYADAVGNGGCMVRWKGPPTCNALVDVDATLGSGTWKKRIAVSPATTPSLVAKPSAVSFGVSASGYQRIALVSQRAPTTIENIRLDDESAFSISGFEGATTLQVGDTLFVDVYRQVVDSAYRVAKIIIDAQPCGIAPLYVSAGDATKPPPKQTLRVVYPNGGERFAVTSRIPLSWEGLPPTEPVRVEVSTDGGYQWMGVSANAKGLSIPWRSSRVPSDSCLLRVTHIADNGGTLQPEFVVSTKQFTEAEISPNGLHIVASDFESDQASRPPEKKLSYFNGKTGEFISGLGSGEFMKFSSNSETLVAWTNSSVSVFTFPQARLLWTRNITSPVRTCCVSADGSRVLIVTYSAQETEVVDAQTGKRITALPLSQETVEWADLSENGKIVAVAFAKGIAKTYDATTGAERTTSSDPTNSRFYRINISPTNDVFATSGDNGAATVWDLSTGRKLNEISRRQFVNDNTYLAFSPDGSRLAVESSTDQTSIADVETGENLVSMRRKSDVGGAKAAGFLGTGSTMFIDVLTKVSIFDAGSGVQIAEVRRGGGHTSATSDGNRIVVLDENRHIVSYAISSPLLQQDVSDAFWTLYKPDGKLAEIDFGKVQVGLFKDSTIVGVVKNLSKRDTLHVTGVRLQGTDANDFSYSIPDVFNVAPLDSATFNITFHPKMGGERQAQLFMESNAGRLASRLFGEGLTSILGAGTKEYDVGTHPLNSPVTATVDSLIVNTGSVPITILSIEPVGINASEFSIIPFDPFVVDVNEQQGIHLVYTPTVEGRVSARLKITAKEINEPIYATIHGTGERSKRDTVASTTDSVIALAPLTDPTTFRGILIPSAVVPKQGTITTSVYDIVGLMAGYSITDNIQVFGGGVVPIPSRWFGATGYDASEGSAWFLGGKYGTQIDSTIIVGGGFAVGQSYYNQDITEPIDSKISFQSMWATGGYGNDDSRLNAMFGYAFKDHDTFLEGRFNADGFMYGLGYDYRIAHNWKVCFEGFFIRTMDFVPLTLTARYFRETDALEFGLTFVGIQASGAPAVGFPFLPMVSWVKRW